MKKNSKRRIAKKITRVRRGSAYSCDICGMSVVVDNICDCPDTCDIICCGEQMSRKKR